MDDFCGGCGERLRRSDAHGARLRCCSDRYWSAADPGAWDEAHYARMNGFAMRRQTACTNKQTGSIVRHAPLYLYGGFFL